MRGALGRAAEVRLERDGDDEPVAVGGDHGGSRRVLEAGELERVELGLHPVDLGDVGPERVERALRLGDLVGIGQVDAVDDERQRLARRGLLGEDVPTLLALRARHARLSRVQPVEQTLPRDTDDGEREEAPGRHEPDQDDEQRVARGRGPQSAEHAAQSGRNVGAGAYPGLVAAAKTPPVELEVGPHTVRLSSPDRVYFPETGATKLDLARYYLAVGDGIVNALRERPCMLHRFPEGLAGEKVHQKRVPAGAPPWLETVRVFFPRYSRTADELCVTELAHVIWAVQMSTVEFHPWNSRRADVEKPDEWRIDLDPGEACDYARVQRVAQVAREVLDELGAVGYPKTSGGSGLHIYVRIVPDHGFGDVRRAALAFAHEVERRAADDVTTTWWRKDRDPALVFVDYNQNARDHTIASAYSVRGVPDARVSTPLRWDEIDDADPRDLTDRDGPGAVRRPR